MDEKELKELVAQGGLAPLLDLEEAGTFFDIVTGHAFVAGRTATSGRAP